MQYEYILMVIPIIIIVAFLVVIAKRMTDGERPDISGAVLGTIIIAVGLLIMVPIISSVDPQYEYDDEDKTFTLYKNVTGTDFSWGSAANAESLIIEDTVTTISAGAFASFTDLKYLIIPDSVETIGEGAFPGLKDYMGQAITEPEAGEYAGKGDGLLYYSDSSIYTYDGSYITGLTAEASSAAFLVIPSKHGGTTLTNIGQNAFINNTAITFVAFLPGTSISSVGQAAFQGCTGITDLKLGTGTIGYGAFQGCTGITDLEIPDGITSLRPRCFQNCFGIETVSLPASLTAIASTIFSGCASVTDVSFASGFAPTTLDATWAPSWTFYDSDGTTVLDDAVAANLAGFTFQGTYTALVKVLPDRSALTLEQTLKVQELTKAAAKALKLEEVDLQISEKAELAEA